MQGVPEIQCIFLYLFCLRCPVDLQCQLDGLVALGCIMQIKRDDRGKVGLNNL